MEHCDWPGAWQIYRSLNMLLCMRTTLDLNDELMRQAKHRAADDGLTLREIFEQALRAYLDRRPQRRKPYRLKLHSTGGGLQPGVSMSDLEHWHRLRDLMDGIE